MGHPKEIIGDIPNGTKIFSKKLAKTDRDFQLIVPERVFEQFAIENGSYERDFTAFDAGGRKWEFILAIRQTGSYDKPVLRPCKWHEFVVAHGLSGDDAEYGVVFYKDDNDNGKLQVRGLKKNHSPLFGKAIWEKV
ncbi:hypothetical protein P3X46_024482 [Hevea brasiliensis]|uniref:TF-B3 domain-containing protein n=1 Tax=Hevea brasiliensis TaxID=3981 RepID=A0ABQ9L667_HEVBR|nr:hypothetical protein P3X46_024482 [Hevea brasiliensis]